MKRNQMKLDVDFIGGAGTLTQKEEEAISAFIKASKAKRSRATTRSQKGKPRKSKRQYA